MINLLSNTSESEFRRQNHCIFSDYLANESLRFNPDDVLKMDPHCHDRNSDVPDELWGRILGLPETWLKTKKLLKLLRKNGCDVITVTNHNNARSCWSLIEKGEDVLVGAEFTCYFSEYSLFVHVLTYGFTREQEDVLNSKRRNIYDFLRYTAEHDIPVILPHPLYFYTRNEKIDLTLFEKIAVMFQRFEVLNGQRDLWQSVLTLNWARSLTPEKINGYAKKHKLNPADFAVDSERAKILTGGSDDHMGIFAGECGSHLYIPDLKKRLLTAKPSELALEAIREGNIAPFGHVAENQKLNIALLDYFSQIATRLEDPGLLRILFHRGEVFDKVSCFVISNLLLELQKHKHTKKFFNFVHDALLGKKPNKLVKWQVSKDYRFCVDYLTRIAGSKRASPEEYINTVNDSITEMFAHLNRLIIARIQKCTKKRNNKKFVKFSTEEITRKFEIPSQLTALFFGSGKKKTDMSDFNVQQLLDSLTFPVMISIILAGTVFASTRLLYQNRRFLNEFAASINNHQHQRRALYLSDTLRDKNGVSNSLSGKLREIQRLDMPVDFLICHPDAEPESHLHVVRPLTRFAVPQYQQQEIRVPDLMEIVKIFYEGGYDRIVCSTEGPMALVSLFIKYMFNVPAYFFMHTDWLDFIRHTTDLSEHECDRVRRFMRAFYKRYDGVFVLNTDHRKWLSGHQMQIEKDKVFLTAHHAQPALTDVAAINKCELFEGATENTPVLFVACRLSTEKGLFELPAIIEKVRRNIPDLRIVIAGTGPDEEELKRILPDAIFLGWVDKTVIAKYYKGLDLFIFPSKFDTFGNVILEAFVYGMPVIAYNCKGPKDIIEDKKSGYLVKTTKQMCQQIIRHFSEITDREAMSRQALRRASEYQAEPVMQQFMQDLGLGEVQEKDAQNAGQRSVA